MTNNNSGAMTWNQEMTQRLMGQGRQTEDPDYLLCNNRILQAGIIGKHFHLMPEDMRAYVEHVYSEMLNKQKTNSQQTLDRLN